MGERFSKNHITELNLIHGKGFQRTIALKRKDMIPFNKIVKTSLKLL